MLLILREGQQEKSLLALASAHLASAKHAAVLGRMQTIDIATAFRSHAAALHTIQLTCAAPVVVFDCGYFEPAIMLLIGLRGAVRRGVSICVTEFPRAESVQFIPYNLQSVALINSAAEWAGGFNEALARLIAASCDELQAERDYSDLPAYRAVSLRRQRASAGEEVLVLCPYAAAYHEACWQASIGPTLAAAFPLRRLGDHASARMVAESFHTRLRDHSRCVADWTMLRPDLFYELGVRIAASNGKTLHLIARATEWTPAPSVPCVDTALGRWPCPPAHAALATRNATLRQTHDLLRLFKPTVYEIGTAGASAVEDALRHWPMNRDGDFERDAREAVGRATSRRGYPQWLR